MKNNLLAIVLPAFLTFLSYSVAYQPKDSLAQNQTTPQTPQLNDLRPPIAQLNPSKPIQIRVVNNSNVDIQTGLTEPVSEEIIVKPNKFVTFGRLNKSYLLLPINLVVYTNAKNINLDTGIRVVNNELIITITSKIDVFGASREINVNKKGNVFVY